jgi:hypothetical protein
MINMQVFIDPENQQLDTLEEFWSLCSKMPQYTCSQFLTSLENKDDNKLTLSPETPAISLPPPPPPSVCSRNLKLSLPPLPDRSSSSYELNLLDWLPPPVPCRSPTIPARRRSQPLPPRSLTLTPRLPRSYMPTLSSTEDLTFSRCEEGYEYDAYMFYGSIF